MNTVFIPFGTRCSAAGIIDEQFKKRTESLPFDWIDCHLNTISYLIKVEPQNVEAHVRNYFAKIEPHKQRHPDNCWFPHDIYPGGPTMEEITDKYVRRHQRLHAHLVNPEDQLVF